MRRYTEAFDGAIAYDGLEVPQGELEAALDRIDRASLRNALEIAAGRVRTYHEKQLKRCLASYVDEDGLGVQVRAIETVGFYAPGTQPAYPSSVLHTIVPAKVAGVENVIVVSPAAPDGRIPDVKLAAAAIAGADRVFCASGAQAVAALAYGTQTIPRVDKICGPGNIFVTLAKRAVYGDVGIDSIYGPTETVIVADDDGRPGDLRRRPHRPGGARRARRADLHHRLAELAEKVVAEVEERLAVLPRSAMARSGSERPRRRRRRRQHRGGRGAGVANTPRSTSASSPKDARRLATLVKNARRHLHRRRLAGGHRRLHGRPKPRHAHRRRRALRIAPQRAGLPQVQHRHRPRRTTASSTSGPLAPSSPAPRASSATPVPSKRDCRR